MDLWAQCRGGEFTGETPPFGGGPAEQPAWLMAAFAVIRASAQALQKKS